MLGAYQDSRPATPGGPPSVKFGMKDWTPLDSAGDSSPMPVQFLDARISLSSSSTWPWPRAYRVSKRRLATSCLPVLAGRGFAVAPDLALHLPGVCLADRLGWIDLFPACVCAQSACETCEPGGGMAPTNEWGWSYMQVGL